jgi:hypothetical protein
MKTVLLFSSACVLAAQQYTISTFAGGAPPVTPIAAVKTDLRPIGGVAADGGNVYFSASGCVFKIDVNGILTRVAGDSRWGASGDGGPATNAEFSTALGVTVDHAGNIYVVDQNGAGSGLPRGTLRKITPDGIISTVVRGLTLVSGLAVDGSNNVYILDWRRVRKLTPDGTVSIFAGSGSDHYSGDGGPALTAGLGNPSAIAADSAGNVYIAANEYFYDDDGDVYPLNGRVRIVTLDGMINTFAGTGVDGNSGDGQSATNAQLGAWLPGLAVDGAGDVFIVDNFNHTIRKVTPDGIITTLQTLDQSSCSLQGSGPNICAQDIAVDPAGRIYIVGASNRYIQMLGSDGSVTTLAGAGSAVYIGDTGQATIAALEVPTGVAADPFGNVYIADNGHNRIRRVAPDGTIVTVAGNGTPRLPDGPVGDGGLALEASLACAPTFSCKGVAADASGNFFFTDNDRVRKVSPDGIITTVASVVAHGLASDGRNLYITDTLGKKLLKLTPDGSLTVAAGDGLGVSLDFGASTYPVDVAVDGAGNVYVAELGGTSSQVRKLTPDGTISTVAGGGNLPPDSDGVIATAVQLAPDLGIAADRDGNVYIAEYEYNRIRKVSTDGIVRTIAGICKPSPETCGIGYSGDGAAATNARLRLPARLAVGSDGTVYVSDTWNSAIRALRAIRQ